jgi:hypothetical protein
MNNTESITLKNAIKGFILLISLFITVPLSLIILYVMLSYSGAKSMKEWLIK